MSQDNENQTAHDESVARLLRLAGHRPPIPEWDAAHVKRAAREEWRRKVESRRRRTLYLRAGALLAAAVLALAAGLAFWPSAGSPAATLEAVVGAVEILPPPGGDDGRTVFAGARLATSNAGPPARAALRLAGGASVRLDAGTRLELVSSTVLALAEGAVYVDSGDGAGELEVRTPLGVARDVGTRFEVRLEPGGESSPRLRVRVREGAVDLARDGDSERADAGVELVVRADGSVSRGTAPGFGPGWDWVVESAPAPEIEGRPLRDLLDWLARESGRELRFADAATESLAATSIMHGSVEGLAPEEAVASLLHGNGLAFRFDGGELVVEGR